jgi:fatty-acyl-CoA synthase
MNELAETVGAKLSRLGARKGSRVAVIAYNSAEYLAIYLAAAKVGYVLVPLNWRLPPRELSRIVRDSSPAIVVYQEGFKRLAEESLDAAGRSRVGRALVEMGELFEGSEPGARVTRPLLGLEDPLMILYTGGTTGAPKGAIVPYRQAVWNAVNTIVSWGLTPGDTAPVFFPFFHTGGWHVLTVPLYMVGGKLVLVPRFDPDKAIEVIERESCTIVVGVPTMFHDMSRSPKFREASFRSVRFFKSGGGMTPESVVKLYTSKGKPFYQGYGLTEAGPNLLYTPPETLEEAPTSVGKPGMFTELRIVKDNGEEARPGEVGELWVRGPVVFAGYLNRDEETREAMTSDGWVRTGDLFTRDDRGYYYFVERRKFMIKTGGENVYPSEVERAIRSLEGVEDAAVFGVPDERWGEAVAAVVKPRTGYKLHQEDIRRRLRGVIAGYKVPKYVWIVEEIPRTPVGKIDYQGLRETYASMLARRRGQS